jgi:hypothetical protein
MIGSAMARSSRIAMVIAMLVLVNATGAVAQTRQRSRPAPSSNSVHVSGYATFGTINFTARESFDAIVGRSSGMIFGGGARVGLPFGGLFVDVGAWRYRADGERVFVANAQVFPLGIPVEITVTPIELSAGWQFRIRRAPKIHPYVAGGLTFLTYRETSDFAAAGEDVDDRFNGYHVIGGAEYTLTHWLGVAGEASWSTVPDAIGEAGVSAAFNETDLGGTTFRLKITIGR